MKKFQTSSFVRFFLLFFFLIQVDCGNFLGGTANLAFQWIFLEGNGETSIYSVSGNVFHCEKILCIKKNKWTKVVLHCSDPMSLKFEQKYCKHVSGWWLN